MVITSLISCENVAFVTNGVQDPFSNGPKNLANLRWDMFFYRRIEENIGYKGLTHFIVEVIWVMLQL